MGAEYLDHFGAAEGGGDGLVIGEHLAQASSMNKSNFMLRIPSDIRSVNPS